MAELRIDEYDELLALHKTLMEAKFHPDPDNRYVAGSPLVARIAERALATLIEMERERGKPEAVDSWQKWARVEEGERFWRAAVLRAAERSGWSTLDSDDKRQYAIDLLSPFRASDDNLENFVREVDSKYVVYAACKQRSAAQANRFLDEFIPKRREMPHEHSLRVLYSDRRGLVGTAGSWVRRLEEKRNEEYALLWKRDGFGEPYQAMLLFTEDGGMIAGLVSMNTNSAELLKELAATVGATYGLVVPEERPLPTLDGFRDLCKTARGNRLVDGEFLTGRSSDQ